jgi:hypothetical protein
MSTKKGKLKDESNGKRRGKLWLVVCAVVVVVIGLALYSGRGGSTPKASPPSPAPDAAPKSAFSVLNGQWARSDGDYMLVIERVDNDGSMKASYLNPRPIHVSQARASREGGTVKMFVELRDQGYPGCTYRLSYDKARDQLFGVYFQAAQQQSYDVVFERAR